MNKMDEMDEMNPMEKMEKTDETTSLLDSLFQGFMSDLSVARDFLNAHLSAELKRLCDLSTLQSVPTDFVEEDLRQYFSDRTYSLNVSGFPGYACTLFGLQESPPPLLPFHILRYQIGVMKYHIDQGNEKLPLVIPVVMYRGSCANVGPMPNIIDFANGDYFRQLLSKEVH